jgi:amidophosphoribosyltransferase
VRYPSAGIGLSHNNTQPLMVNYSGGQISLASNGSLTNAQELRKELESQGSVFQTSVDSEIIVNLIARSKADAIHEKVIESLSKIKGSYCLMVMTRDKLICARDPHGIKPLCIGKLKDGWVLAAESCALDTVGAKLYRDVEPGELIVVDKNGFSSYKFANAQRQARCIFEYVYFARPDSVIDGKCVYEVRTRMGEIMARENSIQADVVIAVPDSGRAAAVGFSQASGILFAEGLIKNRYIGRIFIQPGQQRRESSVQLKLNPVSTSVKGKSVIMVDDSIVRGTTSKKIVKILKDAGAREVHMCISSPPVKHSCYYGIDISDSTELIAASKSVEEIREFLGADSLYYMPLAALEEAIGAKCETSLCSACFSGNYPIAPPKS